MNVRRSRVLQLLTVGVAGSQAGHLVAYQARLGGSALAAQSAGAHAYFLPAFTSVVGAAGASVLAAVLLIAWARLVAGRRLGLQAQPGWRTLDLLPLLFVLQLGVYAGQETLEAITYGTSPPALVDLLLWGALGQLPVAALGAVALAWISTGLEGAFVAVDARLAELQPRLLAPAMAARAAGTSDLAGLLAQCAGASLAKRGPPFTS